MTFVMRVEGLVNGDPTPLDGKLLSRYDPSKFKLRAEIKDTAELAAFLDEWVAATEDPAEALQFESASDALALWQTIGPGLRVADLRPNRPLTAFTVTILPTVTTEPEPAS